ncbi:hypothetical protein J6TS2_32840 [Heyndrickxia sporothermodurans]|nr:hypothetical protein J6TS2_32840 [Heyndrickxia sporothermodurans]
MSKNETSAALEADSPMQSSEKQPKKKIFNNRIVPIIAAILLIGGGTVFAFVLNKSPKELYFLSEYRSYNQMKDEVDELFGDQLKFQNLLLEKPSSSEVNVKGNIDLDPMMVTPEVEMVQEILKNSSISLKSDQDPKKQAGHHTLALNMNKEKVLDVEFFQSKEQLGLKVPALYSKALFLNTAEYGDFMRMQDPYYNGPEKLEFSNFQFKDIKLSEKEKDYLIERYASFLKEQLKDENFTLKKGIEYKFKDEKLKLREVTLKLSSSETKELLTKFMDLVIKDNKLQNMMIKRLEKLAGAQAMASETGTQLPELAQVKEEMKKGLKEAKENLQKVNFPNGFKSVLLINNKEQIVDRSTQITVENNMDKKNILISTKNVPYGDDKKFKEFKVELKDNNDVKAVLQINNDTDENKKDQRKDKLTAEFFTETSGQLDGKIKFKMNSKFDGKLTEKHKIKSDLDLELSGPQFAGLNNALSGTIEQTIDTNIKKEYSNNKMEISLFVNDEGQKGTLSLTVDSKAKLKDKLNLPNPEDDGINVAKMTESQLLEIQQEVGVNIQNLMESLGLSDFLLPSYESYEEESYSGL